MRYLLLSVIIAMGVVGGCCKDDNPVDPGETNGENLLANSAFNFTSVSGEGENLGPGMAEPWQRATQTPQICTWLNCDNNRGHLQMWGCAGKGEGVYQMLRTPIRKGQKYLVKAKIRWWEQHPDIHIRYTTVRFVAFNNVPSGYDYWHANNQGVTVIGSITTEDTVCKEYSLPIWTADADYKGFAFNVENTVPQNGTSLNQSWAWIDDVELIELKGNE